MIRPDLTIATWPSHDLIFPNHVRLKKKFTFRRGRTEAPPNWIWADRKQRRKRVHQPRNRRECVGELAQIDGCEHWWFDDRGPQCTLLVFIDDATRRLMHLQFVAVHGQTGSCCHHPARPDGDAENAVLVAVERHQLAPGLPDRRGWHMEVRESRLALASTG